MNKLHGNNGLTSGRVRPLFFGCGFVMRAYAALIIAINLPAFLSASSQAYLIEGEIEYGVTAEGAQGLE
jgi:hypothetical protein